MNVRAKNLKTKEKPSEFIRQSLVSVGREYPFIGVQQSTEHRNLTYHQAKAGSVSEQDWAAVGCTLELCLRGGRLTLKHIVKAGLVSQVEVYRELKLFV